MNKYKFELEEKSKNDSLWIHLMYSGGDADSEHPEEYQLDIKFSEYENHLEKIDEEVKKYKILEKLTSDNHGENLEYEDLEEKYGEDIANMYDNVPNDPQGDYQFKTSLDSITLVGYDKEGNKYECCV